MSLHVEAICLQLMSLLALQWTAILTTEAEKGIKSSLQREAGSLNH